MLSSHLDTLFEFKFVFWRNAHFAAGAFAVNEPSNGWKRPVGVTVMAAFASRSERALATSVLRDDFGETAAKVAELLLRSEGLRLAELAVALQRAPSSTGPPPALHEVKGVLLKLLQHNVLSVVPQAKGSAQPVVGYAVNLREVLYRLRFPKFLEQAKQAFGLAGEVVMEELLVHGRVRLDQSVDAMALELAEQKRAEQKQQQAEQQQDEEQQQEDEEVGEDELQACREQIRAAFVDMAKRRYISRVHPLDLKVPEPEAQPDFPLAITRGQDGGAGKRAGASKDKDKDSSTATGDKRTDEDGITVRERKKRRAAAPAGNAVPVELQMMLEADEAQRKAEDSEAEYDPNEDSGGAGKKRKLAKSKRAKLPTRGVSALAQAAAGGEGDESGEGGGGALAEHSLVWRFGAEQLLRDLRHRACVRFATENINAVAGAIVAAMLRHSAPHERELNEPTSFPVSARDLFAMDEVKNALPKESKDTWRLLLNYITVMCRDKSGMVLKVAPEAFDPSQPRPGDGGQYVVHLKKIVEFLQLATTHAYISDKLGAPSARIVRLLLEKRQLEQKTIGELALLPSHDARRRLYALLQERLVQVQEVPKRADHNPAFTFFCWSVDVPTMHASLVARLEAALCKLRRRRRQQAEDHKDLIARGDQLVEQHDLDRFDRLSRALDRLDRAAIRLDAMLMLYRDF